MTAWLGRLLPRLGAPMGALALAGCAGGPRSPMLPVLGAFFPVWLFAALFGVAATLTMRVVFIRVGVHDRLPAPLLVYLCAALAFSIGGWAVWLGEGPPLDR
ncbi:MAG: hypothetical protein EA355_01360 [Rhodobacteraceae bacterium]|nr:MAG: hypothetical protein EA355_01360 [Paracoccaceae bacterium]